LPVTLGFKVGIPVTDMFSASNTSLFGGNQPGSNYTSAVPRYEFGVTGEFHLPKHLRLEVDGLYKRSGFASSAPFDSLGNLSYEKTSLNVWEIPALIKTNIKVGRFHPFVDAGAALRHVSTITETGFVPGFSSPLLNDNSSALHNRNSFGGVAGFGITFKKGPFQLSPEARYTRWANQSFMAPGLRTNLDQGDVLLGVTF
jgi:opacity protein-like surface antigen